MKKSQLKKRISKLESDLYKIIMEPDKMETKALVQGYHIHFGIEKSMMFGSLDLEKEETCIGLVPYLKKLNKMPEEKTFIFSKHSSPEIKERYEKTESELNPKEKQLLYGQLLSVWENQPRENQITFLNYQTIKLKG